MNGFGTLIVSILNVWGVLILLPILLLQSTQDLGKLAHQYFILIFKSVSMITSYNGSIVNLIEPNSTLIEALVQSLIYRLAGLLWVTYTGVIGYHYN